MILVFSTCKKKSALNFSISTSKIHLAEVPLAKFESSLYEAAERQRQRTRTEPGRVSGPPIETPAKYEFQSAFYPSKISGVGTQFRLLLVHVLSGPN